MRYQPLTTPTGSRDFNSVNETLARANVALAQLELRVAASAKKNNLYLMVLPASNSTTMAGRRDRIQDQIAAIKRDLGQ